MVTVDRLVVNSHDASTAVNKLSSLLTTTTTTRFIDNATDLPWRNVLSPEFETKFQREA